MYQNINILGDFPGCACVSDRFRSGRPADDGQAGPMAK